jgi:hypothetical protein
MRKTAALAFVVFATIACHRSGTWVDDPGNVKRAWGVDLPSDVAVRHSWYWRSAHFTREEAYYFQFGWNEPLFEGFIKENRMSPASGSALYEVSERRCFDRPAWFAPGSLSAYDVWIGPDATNGVLLRDKKTREIFIAACQL